MRRSNGSRRVERVEVASDARLLNQLALLPDAQRHTFFI